MLHRNCRVLRKEGELAWKWHEEQGGSLRSLYTLVGLKKGAQRTVFSGDSQVFLKQGQVPFKTQVAVTSNFSGDRPRVLEGIVGGLGAERGRRLVRLGI